MKLFRQTRDQHWLRGFRAGKVAKHNQMLKFLAKKHNEYVRDGRRSGARVCIELVEALNALADD